jgi:hypothetical protein
MNFSFANLQASNLTSALVARVNAQIHQAASLDEQFEVDQAPGQPGEVLLDQSDSFVQLSYDPSAGSPKSFAFKAHLDLMAQDGTVVVPGGTESSYAASQGGESFRLQVPTEQGVVTQEAVLNNDKETVLFSDGVSPAQEFSFQTLQAAQATSALVQKLQVQIAQTAGADEQSGVDLTSGQPGQVLLQDAGSKVQLSVDPATSMPQSFTFKATQNLAAEDGTVLVAAGTETAYLREGNVETFRQDIPTPQGTVRQQATLDNAAATVDFQEYILSA